MKKYILDLTVTENVRLHAHYVLLKLTSSQMELPEMLPGQFAEIRVDGSPTTFLRRPISINYVDRQRNEVWFLIQLVGDGTKRLGEAKAGDVINVVLPLGNGFTMPENASDKLLLVGGGVGTAPMLSQLIIKYKKGRELTSPSILKPPAGRFHQHINHCCRWFFIKRFPSRNFITTTMRTTKFLAACLLTLSVFSCKQPDYNSKDAEIEKKVEALLSKMTLEEKIGQMNQISSSGNIEEMSELIKKGEIGSILNEVDPVRVNQLQRAAVEGSRLGIPVLIARDVIHGFKTIFPIPLGQAASFDPEIAREGARVAAVEASSVGVRWTFAPMIDISRDPRWGRIAESCGEDPYLTAVMGAAMVKGFQGPPLTSESV